MAPNNDLEEGEIACSSPGEPRVTNIKVEDFDESSSVGEALNHQRLVATKSSSRYPSQEAISFLDSISVTPNESNTKRTKDNVPVFVEGDKKLHHFPPNLLNQLWYNRRKYNTDMPSCAQPMWCNSDQILWPVGKPPNPFIISKTKEVLLCARYAIGKQDQVIVVKQFSGSSFMDGKPAIVFLPPDQRQDSVVWRVWDPALENGEFNSRAPALARQRGDNGASSSLPSRYRKANSPSTNVESYANHKRLRRSTVPSPDNSEPGRLTPMEHPCESSSSPVLDYRAATRMQGFAVPMENIVAKVDKTSTTKTVQAKSVLARPFVPSAALASDLCPYFIFKLSTWGPEQRRRRFTECDTSRKLFGQAICAGIINTDDIVLKVELPGQGVLFLMKDDIADFRLLEAGLEAEARLCGTGHFPVMVTRVDGW